MQQTVMSIANESIKRKLSKPIVMHYSWVQDKVRNNTFNVFWKPGQMNFADYPSKHHAALHHIKVRHTYVHQANVLLRGCINLRPDYSTENTNTNFLRTSQQCIATHK